MKWVIEYLASVVVLFVAGVFFLASLYNAFTGYGMNWPVFIVSGVVLFGSGLFNTLLTE